MNDPDSLLALGKRHLAEGRPAEAHACLIQAAALRPDDDTIHAELAWSLYLAGRADEAVPLYRALVARTPDDLAYLVDLGRALRAVGAYAEALRVYRQALARRPREVALLNNIGNCHLALCDLDAAITSFRSAIAEKPDYVDAHHNLGLALLTAGQTREGWEEYRWRLLTPGHRQKGKAIQEWDGSPMAGKTLLVRAEQGLGDTLQFCRYLPAIASRARIIAAVQRPLKRLLTGMPGVDLVVTDGDPGVSHDAECVMMSLPRLLGSYDPVGSGPVPYLHPDPLAIGRWRERLAGLPGPKVGLVWAGSPGLGTAVLLDRRRSLPLSAFAPLRGPTFISLQKGPAAIQARRPPDGMVLIDWTEELMDFADTAALVAALDLVISVDTSVAHLAGALGRPIWMLNRTDTDWRWGVSGETTGWYPTMRIFRQRVDGDWDAPIAAMAAALRSTGTAVMLARDEGSLRRLDAERPGEPAVHAALARCLLMAGKWAEGWFWQRRAYTDTAALWDGTAMDGETLLLHADDPVEVLLYGRYVAAAVERSRARVVLSVPAQVQRLMVGGHGVAVSTVPRPSHHRHCPFGLLPAVFQARENTVPDVDLCPMPSLPMIESWSSRVTRLRGVRVGMAFDDRALQAQLERVPGVDLVVLTEGFEDLASAAGLIVHLDLVIAADGILAHLAGALGRPVWLIEPNVPAWPWLPDRTDNPWYPTLRQIAAGEAVDALTDFAGGMPEETTFAYANDCYLRRDYRAAAVGFRQALALNAGHAGALGNLAMTALILARPEVAVRYADQAVRVAPGSHPLRLRLGLALHAAGHFDDAVGQLRQARAMAPDHPDTLSALGNALAAAGMLGAAIEAQRGAIAIRPDGASYRTNLAYTLLRAGQWDEGWREHEYRPERPRGGPVWDGGRLTDKPLLLRHEQGLGDTIQFCRYAPLAAARAGGPVFLTVPGPLRSLLSGLPGVTVLAGNETPPANVVQYPLLSLPLLFGTTYRTVPADVPYLHADLARMAYWRTRVSALSGLRIGVVWAGNPRLGTASLGATDRRRSLPEGALALLRQVPGVTFVSLQLGDVVDPGVPVLDWTAELGDLAETAALAATLDLVISVDTAVAHLAGALGRPVWLLNRFDTDWRWGDGTETSGWYPTMRVFRQGQAGDWDGVVERLKRELSRITDDQSRPHSIC